MERILLVSIGCMDVRASIHEEAQHPGCLNAKHQRVAVLVTRVYIDWRGNDQPLDGIKFFLAGMAD